MQSSISTYRNQLLRGLARASNGGSELDPRSIGLELNDPDGYLRLEQVTLGLEEVVISRASSTGYRARMREDAYFTFVFQREGRYDLQISGSDYTMKPGSLLAFRPNERSSQVVPGKTGMREVATLQLPIARMEVLAEAAETSASKAIPRDGISLQGEVGQSLAFILPQLSDALLLRPSLPLPPRVAQEITNVIDEVVCALVGRLGEQTASRRIFPAFHRVRQAEDFMHAHSDDPVSILEIARSLGVSVRSLQLAFNEVYGGLSPRGYLNQIRLEKARRRLLAPNGNSQVTTVALDSGFFHLSRFAQAYARAFGERPSETLARCRG